VQILQKSEIDPAEIENGLEDDPMRFKGISINVG
jgi:hypothetical protein